MLPRPRFPLTLIGLVTYAAVLQWTFRVKIAPVFDYLGARYRDPDPTSYALVFLLLVIVALTLPPRLQEPSDGVVWVLFVTLIVPAALIPQYALILTEDRALILGIASAVVFTAISVLAHARPVRGVRLHVDARLLWLAIVGFSLLTYAAVSAVFGLRLTAFSLDVVRELRFAYRDQISTGVPFLAYLIRYQGSVLNPFLMAHGVLIGRRLPVIAGALGQGLLYSATGYKLFFLSVPVILILTWLLKRRPALAGQAVMFGVLASSLVALGVDRLRGGPILWTEIVVDRMLIIPGMLSAAYLSVFADRPKYNFAEVIPLSGLGNSYGDISPGFYVGAAFSGSAQANANAGFIGDGYAQAGYVGILIEAFVVLLILWGANAAGRHLPTAITLPILLLPTLSLGNVSPTTTLLTGGFGFAFLLMATLPGDWWPTSRPRTASAPSRTRTPGRTPGSTPRRTRGPAQPR